MMIFKKIEFVKKRKGSATVEAAMIFPLIMFILFGIIYLTIVHYQNNVMIAESIRAMNRAGAYWQYVDTGYKKNTKGKGVRDITLTPNPFIQEVAHYDVISDDMITNRNPYRTIIDIISEGVSKLFDVPVGKRKENAGKYVSSRIANVKFKQYEGDIFTKVEDVEGGGFMFFGEDLKVNITRNYKNLFSDLAKSFLGENNTLENSKKKEIIVSSVISNQAEFVRNLDTVYDLGVNIYNMVKPKSEE